MLSDIYLQDVKTIFTSFNEVYYSQKCANFLSVRMSRPQYLLRYGRCSCDPCSSAYAFQHNSQLLGAQRCALCPNFLTSLQTPDRSWPAFSIRCCNTTNSLIGAEYKKQFRWPDRQNSRKLRSGNYQSLASYQGSPNVLFGRCLTTPT
jgi:hypothetical protein